MKKTEFRNKRIVILFLSFLVEDLNNLSSVMLSVSKTCKKVLVSRGAWKVGKNDK